MRRIQAVFTATSVFSDNHSFTWFRKLTNHRQQERPGVHRFVKQMVAFAVDEAREDSMP